MSASPVQPEPRAHVDEPAEASYTTSRVRLLLPGGAFDLVPDVGPATARPSDLGFAGRLYVINASAPPNAPASARDHTASADAFVSALDRLGWDYVRALVFPPSQVWVESSVALTGLDELDLHVLTYGRNLPGVRYWDDDGLSFWPASSLRAVRGPVPVSIRPVERGSDLAS